jgi:tetratricopeptide (TPR) repeat protein
VAEDVRLAQEHARDLDAAQRARVDLLCGDALSGVGVNDPAETMLTRAAEEFRRAGNDGAEGWAVLRLLRAVAHGRGDFAAADELFPRALRKLERAGDLQLLAYARLALANRARLLGRFPEALEFARDALQRYETLGLTSPVNYVLAYVSECLTATGQPAEALDVAREMRQRCRSANLASWVVAAELLEAQALLRLGEPAEALLVLDAIQERTEVGDPWIAGAAQLVRVEALLVGGDIERAGATIPEARAACEWAGHPWYTAWSWLVLGETELATGRAEEATAAFTRGLERYEGLHQHPPGAAASCEGLAAAARVHGLPEDVARWLGAATHFRDECGAVATPGTQARNRNLMSWSAQQLGSAGFHTSWHEGEAWAVRWLEDSLWDRDASLRSVG